MGLGPVRARTVPACRTRSRRRRRTATLHPMITALARRLAFLLIAAGHCATFALAGTQALPPRLQQILSAQGISASQVSIAIRDPRSGDIRNSLADISKAVKLLGWKPTRDIKTMVSDTWESFNAPASK